MISSFGEKMSQIPIKEWSRSSIWSGRSDRPILCVFTILSFLFSGAPQIQNIYGASANLMAPPEMHFSGRHNGLYLYFSRLLRPLWHRTLVIPGSEPQKPLTSSVSPEEVEWIVIQLLDLRSFLEKQMTSMIPTGINSILIFRIVG